MKVLHRGDSQVLNGSLIVFSRRSADVFPVVASLPPKICLQLGKQKNINSSFRKGGRTGDCGKKHIFFPFIFLATRTSSGAFIFLPSTAWGKEASSYSAVTVA